MAKKAKVSEAEITALIRTVENLSMDLMQIKNSVRDGNADPIKDANEAAKTFSHLATEASSMVSAILFRKSFEDQISELEALKREQIKRDVA